MISAVNEVDLHNQLQRAGLELLQCMPLRQKKGALGNISFGGRVKIRDLIQLFVQLEQMQSAGVTLLDALGDMRDTVDDGMLRDVFSDMIRDISEGSSLSESMEMHPKVFNSLYISLVASGEETGDMTGSYRQLVKYLKWVDKMQTKIRKATRYPMIVTVVVLLTVTIMMTVVVPQIVGFLNNLDQDIPFYTSALMATSAFFVNYWWLVLITPVILIFLYKFLRKTSDGIAYRFDAIILTLPVFGSMIRKISIARYSQTFGAMYASGIDVLTALESARRTVSNIAILDALEGVQEQVKAGSPLSEAFNTSGEFPSLVVRMIKVGEESGNLTSVLDQVAEFYTNDVDEAIEGLITMIEPFLTAFLGGMILWIAVAVFGPIYSSFENIDF